MKTKTILYYLFCLLGLSLNGQSLTPSENYIYTRVYTEAVASSSSTAKQLESIQYFDGLGRPKQSVAVKATPNQKDMVSVITYDKQGRQTKSYLPIPVASNNGAYHSSLDSTSANSYYGIGNAFSEVLLERSPLARVYKAAKPGADWGINTNHTVKYDYATNSDNEVKHIVATATWNPTTKINDITLSLAADDDYNLSGFYKAQTLSKKMVRDEDNQEMIVYANSAGQSLMERKVNIKSDGTPEYLDTYYVYDDFGNMVLVIPPKAAVFTNLAQLTSFLSPLCYQYRYDRFHRLAEKRLPGRANWESIVYDKQHRIVLMQDAAQKGKQWTFTKYDRYGRTAYTGLFANTASRTAMQTALNNMSANALNNEERNTTGFTQNGITVYYTKQAFPTGSMTLMSVNYYDDYPASPIARPDYIQNVPTLGSAPTTVHLNGKTTSRSTKGMATMSLVKNTGNDAWTRSHVWYDRQGRAIGSHTTNHLGGSTRTESVLDFSGAVTTSYTYHKRLTGNTEVVIKQSFSYDDQKRLLVHKHQVNNKPEEILTRNEYNELGQLRTKKVGGTDIAVPLEVMTYDYNIRGWMTGINLNSNATHHTSSLFSYKINYNNTLEGLANPNTEVQQPITPRYNGSIAETSWRSGTSTQINRYGYVYDRVNRMVAGLYQNPANASSKEHSEIVTYDLNGNISRLKRSSYQVGTSASLIDDLHYSYGGNQLTSVLDDSDDSNGYGAGSNPISYDANGNMTDMLDKSITTITYNYLNLPVTMNVWMRNGNANITNTYRADGTKLRKQNVTARRGIDSSTTTTTTATTDYLDGFHYLTQQTTSTGGRSPVAEEAETELAVAMEREAYMSVAKAALPVDGGGPVLAENAVLQYIPTAEGFYDFTENKYIYQYKDHVGNVRVSFAKNSGGSTELIEINDYYPFGMNHLGPDNLSSFGQGAYQNYKYNGKELQETGFLDYGWRQYMPELGRWFGMDQLSESYLSHSPYAYVLNNPAMYNDVDGRLHQFKMAEENEGLEFSKGLNDMLTTGSKQSTDAWNALNNWGNDNGNDYYSEFGNTPAYMDAMSFLSGNNQGTFNLTNKNGIMSWWTDMQSTGISGDIQGLAGYSLKLGNTNPNQDWMGVFGKWNASIGFGATGIEQISGSFRLATSAQGFSPKYYANAWRGNQYAKTYNIGKIGKGLGVTGFFAGAFVDGVGVYNYTNNANSPNTVNPVKAGINTGMGLWGLFGGVPGAAASAGYTVIDAFYPGGWDGAMNDTSRRQAEFDRIINQNSGMAPQYIFPYGSQKF